MKKISMYFTVITASLAFFFNPVSHAQDTPEYARTRAFNKISVATEFMQQAGKMVNEYPNRANLKPAIGLYVKAGKLFEAARNILSALGPDYVSQDDIEGCSRAMDICVGSIQNLKELL